MVALTCSEVRCERMSRPPHRDLDPTLRPQAPASRRVVWDEVTAPSHSEARALHVTDPDNEDERVQIGRYAVLRKLGSGGMGVVYAAFDESLDRKIAIKVLRDRGGDPQGQQRLLREAQALARLSHPNVVAVHDVGTTDDLQVYIAMEFITGVTLRTWLEERPRSRAEVLRVLSQAGRGLAAAHAVGLIHRDFKPDNVMVASDGRAWVFDFGLARSAADVEPAAVPDPRRETDLIASGQRPISSMTVAGTVLGTPGYMAPEQHDGEVADARTDVFSFCVTLYEALYSERPFAGDTYGELVALVRAGEIRAAPLGVAVPTWLRQIVVRGLQPVPSDRWPDMPELLTALAADPVAQRRRVLRRVGAVALLIGMVIGLPYLWGEAQRVWAHERSEALATRRWDVVQARIAALEQEGEPAEGEAAFAAFVHAEEHRGTRALTLAWLDHGARRLRADDRQAALAAFARAYTEAGERDLEIEAMRAMAGVFHEAWAWEPLAQALTALREAGAETDPDLVELGVDEALVHRDLPRALQVLAGLAPDVTQSPYAGLRPLLQALAGMRRTSLPAREASVVDLDGDRRGDLLLLDSSRRVVTLVDHNLQVLRSDRLPAPVSHFVPGQPRALVHDGQNLQLYTLGAAPVRTWQQPSASKPYTVAAIDLADDGQPDLYIGFESPARRFAVLPDAGTRIDAPLLPAHPSTEASASDVEALASADLDGDGTRELIAGVGAWTAYDLRVYQHAPEGLALRAYRRMGRIGGVTIVRDAEGRARIAVAKDDIYPNREIFASPPHTGAAAGVYLLRWTGAALVEDGFVPFPQVDGRSALELDRLMVAGDLDGDGLEEIVLAASHQPAHMHAPRRALTLVLRQRIDATFIPLALGGIVPLGLFDADDDPARELLAIAEGQPDELWLLGVGDDVMDPLPRASSAPVEAPADLGDPGLVRDWQRASQLERVGLAREAATTLRDAAHFAGDPHHRRVMLGRAGDILLADGDDAGARDLFRQVAADPRLAPAALAKSAEAAVQLGRYADAHAALLTLLGLPGVSAAQVQAARARLVEVEPLARPAHEFRVDFDRPLAPAWHIHDPSAVRRDPGEGVLRITTFAGQREVAALPILWDGGPLRLHVDLVREHLELGASLRVVVRGDDGSLWLGAGLAASGGGGLVDASVQCWNRHHGVWETVDDHAQTSADTRESLRVRVEVLPGVGPDTCTVTDERGTTRRLRGSPTAPGPAGRYWLSIGVYPDRPIDLAMTRASIRSIQVEGAEVLPPAPESGAAAARRKLAEGQPLAALALLSEQDTQLAEPDGPDPQRFLWEAVAHDDLDHGPERVAALRRALPTDLTAPLDPAVLRLLRLRPTSMGAALRELLGPRFFAAYDAAWGSTIHHHRYDPYLHRRITSDLADLDAFAPHSPAEWSLKFRLLALRGRSWLRLGVTDRAREDLRAAAAMLPQVPVGETAHIVALVWILAAKVTASEDRDEALGYARIAVATSPTPELVAEQLRSDPDLGAFQADPAWAAVFAPASTPGLAAPSPSPVPAAPP